MDQEPAELETKARAFAERGNDNDGILHPEEYENENDRKRKIGLAVGARKGDVIEYFESDCKEGYSLNAKDISIKRYKIMLWKAIQGILEIASHDIAAIKRELFEPKTISHTVTPSRGVAGSMTSYANSVSGANEVANDCNEKGGEL